MSRQTPQEESRGMSSIRVSVELRARLAKIGARLTLKDGQIRTMEELIEMLADAYEREEKESKK